MDELKELECTRKAITEDMDDLYYTLKEEVYLEIINELKKEIILLKQKTK